MICPEVDSTLENEQFITDVLAAVEGTQQQRSKLTTAYQRASELLPGALDAVRTATQQNAQHAWPQLLEMPQPELCHSEPPAELVSGLKALHQQLDSLRHDRSAAWAALYHTLLEGSCSRATQADRFLGLEVPPKPDAILAQLPQPVLQRLQDLAAVGSEVAAPTEAARKVRSQLLDLTRAQSLPMDRQASGQVEWAKVQLQTRLITHLKEMLRAIDDAEAENARLGADIADLRQQCEAQTAVLSEPRWKLKLQAERALSAVNDALVVMDRQDSDASKKHADDMARSEATVQANLQRQSECWQQIEALQQELQRLGGMRRKEVEWQLQEQARETRRVEEYKWAHQVGGEHKRRLECTLRHCEGGLRCVSAVDSFVAEGTEAAFIRHGLVSQELAQTKLAVLAEKEQELARLQQWGGEHRVTVATTLHDVQATSPVPRGGGGSGAWPAPPQSLRQV